MLTNRSLCLTVSVGGEKPLIEIWINMCYSRCSQGRQNMNQTNKSLLWRDNVAGKYDRDNMAGG